MLEFASDVGLVCYGYIRCDDVMAKMPVSNSVRLCLSQTHCVMAVVCCVPCSACHGESFLLDLRHCYFQILSNGQFYHRDVFRKV